MHFSKLLALFAASVALAAPAAEPEPGTLVARAASIAGVQGTPPFHSDHVSKVLT